MLYITVKDEHSNTSKRTTPPDQYEGGLIRSMELQFLIQHLKTDHKINLRGLIRVLLLMELQFLIQHLKTDHTLQINLRGLDTSPVANGTPIPNATAQNGLLTPDQYEGSDTSAVANGTQFLMQHLKTDHPLQINLRSLIGVLLLMELQFLMQHLKTDHPFSKN